MPFSLSWAQLTVSSDARYFALRSSSIPPSGTHILLTIHYLPSPVSSGSFPVVFAAKLLALTDYRAWNSLLFGNIFITLVLFTFRAAWWVGIGRDTFAGVGATRKDKGQ